MFERVLLFEFFGSGQIRDIVDNLIHLQEIFIEL